MFKYFVYNAHESMRSSNASSLPDNNKLVVTQIDLEVLNCYNDPYTNNTTGYEPCRKACNYTHRNWSSGQRYNFYKLIYGAPICENIYPNSACDYPLLEEPEECLPIANCLKDKANLQIDKAKAACSNRKEEYRQVIIDELVQSCYTIVECASSNPSFPEITLPQIDAMVIEVVNACEAKIDAIDEKLNTTSSGLMYWDGYNQVVSTDEQVDVGEYPYREEVGCASFNKETLLVEKITYFKEVLFAPCDQQVLDQVMYWNFDIDIPSPLPDCPSEKDKDWKNTSNPDDPLYPSCEVKSTSSGGTYSIELPIIDPSGN